MNLLKFGKTLVLGSMILGSSVLLTDCTPKITEEQKAQLMELRREETSLKNQISDVNRETVKLQDEFKARQQELKKCNDDKEFVEGKLSEWPNVWPDYNPAEENAAEEGEGEN